jgi:hypothetical protein
MTKIFGTWSEVRDGAWRTLIPSRKSKTSDEITDSPETPAPEAKAEPAPVAEQKSLIDTFNALVGAAQTAFFKIHHPELSTALITKS